MVKYNPGLLERPASVSEALSTLAKWGAKARVVAGNTTIYELANQGGLMDVEMLLDASNLGLDYVTLDDQGTIHIGAMTTFSKMGSSSALRRPSSHALVDVAEKLTPPQIRNMATIGGAACSGIPFYDTPVTLLALEATFNVASSEGTRNVSAKDFFVDYFVTALSPKDLLLEVDIPDTTRIGSAFSKLGRTSVDFAMVNCACTITFSRNRTITNGRIALGAVSNAPIRCEVAEEFLREKEANAETFYKAGSLAVDFEPSPSIHASSEYKKKIIPIVVRDTLIAAARRAEEAVIPS